MTLAVAVAVGLAIGLLLGSLGGGGSILTVPALVYLLGQSAQEATATSLVIVGLTAAVASVGHARSGHTRWTSGALLAAAGVPASVLGSTLNASVDGNVVLLAFSGLVLLAAAGMLARSPQPVQDETGPETTEAVKGRTDRGGGATATRTRPAPVQARVVGQRRWLRVLLAGLLIGALTGFFGVGGGFVIVPVLVVALRFPMPDAVGTSLVVIAVNSAVALAARSSAGLDLDPAVVVPFTAAAIAASLVGKRGADRLSGTSLTRSFGGLLVLVAIYVGTRAVLGLT